MLQMKRIILSGTLLFGLIMGSVISANAQNTFTRARVPQPKPLPQVQKAADYQTPLLKATELHNFLNKLPDYKLDQTRFERAKDQTVQDRRRHAAMEACNIQRLEEYFKNPEEVWRKMKEKYDGDEKDLAIYFNSSTVLSPDEKKTQLLTSNHPATDQELSEMFMYWSLGRAILNDVYQNPEQWGDPKKPNTAVFPLWKDQKYLVDRAYDQKYNEINAFFGIPPTGRPLIGDSKYDYKQHGEVVLAHNAYIAALSAAKPERALLMPDRMRQAPAAAPKPLPPVGESVIYLKNQDGTTALFPETPAPWQTFAESGFTAYNPNGEMGQDFVGRSFQVRSDVGQRSPDTLNHNRLEVYQALKKQLSSSEKIQEVTQRQHDVIQKTAQGMMTKYNLVVEPDVTGQIDFKNEARMKVLKEQIKARKKAYLDEAAAAIAANEANGLAVQMPPVERAAKEAYINQKIKNGADKQALYQQVKEIISLTPEEQARRLIAALRTDEEGDVYLTRANVADIEGQIKASRAARSLREEAELQVEAQLKKYRRQKKIDETCLNQGDML